uniref:PiggyBac transposable element-derived protein domain-containing protein n=1 Tax=Anopheles coluzzii TaxID=1518534 RepID=A0A8W7PT53_ANOCL
MGDAMHVQWLSEEAEEVPENEEDMLYEDVEYIEEYVHFPDGPETDVSGSVAVQNEESTGHVIKIESIDHAFDMLQNSVWSIKPPERTGTMGRKVAHPRPAPVGLAKSAKSPAECLSLFLDADVIAMITEYTNEQIKAEQPNYARERDANPTDEMEIMALLGVLYIAGTVRDGRENIERLFDTKMGTGLEAVYLTMTSLRYHFLIRSIRFDDPTAAQDEIEGDKLAPVRPIYERIVSNYQKYLRPGRFLMLDEQAVQFKGKCEFRQILPSAPGRAGFRFHLLVDCETSYVSNLEICVPENQNPYNLSYAPTDVAMRLTEPVQGRQKTVILGAGLTSIDLIEKLYASRTMAMGEVPKSYPDLPKALIANKGRPEHSTLAAYHDPATLVSYVTKRKEVMLLMSSFVDFDSEEQAGEQDEGEQHLKLVELYNRTKTTIRTIQQMCAKHNVVRSTRRWPVAVFFNLMNLSAINAWCIYCLNHPEEAKMSRRDFLVTMALELLRPQARRRLDSKTLPRLLRQRIGLFLGISREEYETVPVVERQGGESRGRCYLCGRARNKTTRISCHSCGKYTCNAHCAQLCRTCYMDDCASEQQE